MPKLNLFTHGKVRGYEDEELGVHVDQGGDTHRSQQSNADNDLGIVNESPKAKKNKKDFDDDENDPDKSPRPLPSARSSNDENDPDKSPRSLSSPRTPRGVNEENDPDLSPRTPRTPRGGTRGGAMPEESPV